MKNGTYTQLSTPAPSTKLSHKANQFKLYHQTLSTKKNQVKKPTDCSKNVKGSLNHKYTKLNNTLNKTSQPKNSYLQINRVPQ